MRETYDSSKNRRAGDVRIFVSVENRSHDPSARAPPASYVTRRSLMNVCAREIREHIIVRAGQSREC